MAEVSEQQTTIYNQRHALVVDVLEGYGDVPPEQLKAIITKQDILFCFSTRLENYEELRTTLKDPSLAACMYVGNMVWSFVDAQVSLGPQQLEHGKEVFYQASQDLGNLWLRRGDDALLAEATTLRNLGEAMEVIAGVAEKLHARWDL